MGELEPLIRQIPEIPTGKTHHLFISHSGEDHDWAWNLVEKLEKIGLKCQWPHRDFIPGKGIIGEIHSGIAQSMMVLFILSPSFCDSNWCMQETEWTLVLSYEEQRNRAIPLLFSPCKVPEMLRHYNFIDVPRGEDYVTRIVKSFVIEDYKVRPRVHSSREGELTLILPKMKHFIRRDGSGKQGDIQGRKSVNGSCNGPSWCFNELDQDESEELKSLGSQLAGHVYDEIRGILNKSSYLRYFALWEKSCDWFFTWLLSWMVWAILLAMLATILVYEQQSYSTSLYLLIPAGVGFLGIPLGLKMCRKKSMRTLEKTVVRYNENNALRTNMLVHFKVVCQTPLLRLMFYDLRPCVDFLVEKHLLNLAASGKVRTMENEAIVQGEIEKLVLGYLLGRTDIFFDWHHLPDSNINRHPTYLNKTCMCEILEKVI